MKTRQYEILIAEDESIIALDIKNFLEKSGYKISSVVNKSENILERVENLKPDLVLMDIFLNGKESGLEIAETIYNRFRIPIIYLTGLNDDETFRRASKAGTYGFLLKPFDETTLESAIKEALIQHRKEKN